ncbi:putative Fe-S protein [Thalassovita gelatinovora]|uniref:Putative Fe-S protein n=1 Tax=Thalassovita gelatinovora TaxID=53501 RepID=A0A0P1FGX0_THAGE|nr:MOSC domain-containing protein [Thalassovita gelatinovora]QIZ81812.1 MOSC domain-containing protein [Thalassovita gelatinovora]CUH67092.1 putative Fe-S protein [Thalassovita gelatinovora]SEP80786.1 hypothetical protein SAMN04488043_101454 [Thalassovita gelatinovora]
MSHLAHIVRHPIKSVGYEVLQSAPLSEGRVLPFDRHWAVAHEAARFDGRPTEWMAKGNFIRGVAGHPLMAVKAALNEINATVTLAHPEAETITVQPIEDGPALIDWLRPFWPDNRPAPTQVISLKDQAMTDVPDPYVAILSLGSLQALGDRMGRDLSIHRFRGNLWTEGWPPFAEFDLIGKTIRIGAAELKVETRITRCQATTVNPETGHCDADTLAALNAAYGHQDFGVYARVVKSGTVTINDMVETL